MHTVLERLEHLTKQELDKIVAKGDMTPAELDSATKAVCLLKEIHEVEGVVSDESKGSGVQNRMIANLEKMMNEAESEQEKQAIQAEIHRLSAEQ